MSDRTCHPNELQLAAFAGGEAGFFHRLIVGRHVAACESCRGTVAAFRDLRSDVAAAPGPDVNWEALAAEMRANIRLGLEAGECVRGSGERRYTMARLAIAFATVVLLAGTVFFVRTHRPRIERPASPGIASAPVAAPRAMFPEYRSPVLESSVQGIEVRSGRSSFAFLNRAGQPASQTVSAEGAVRSRDIDGDTGSVTIKDVYLQ